MKKWMGVIISACVMCLVIVVCVIASTGAASDAEHAQAQVDTIQNQIEIAKSDMSVKEDTVVSGVTGLDSSRLAKDTEIIEQFLEHCLTWSTYDEYVAVRNDVMTKYGLSNDSQFMTVFMPNIKNEVLAGENYNAIDVNNLNMQFEECDVNVTKISPTVYSYFSIVSVSTTTLKGAEAIGKIAVTYSIDKDGQISDLSAIPLTNDIAAY